MLDITSESSAWQTIHMKCQALFFLKNKKQKETVVCSRIFLGALRVKDVCREVYDFIVICCIQLIEKLFDKQNYHCLSSDNSLCLWKKVHHKLCTTLLLGSKAPMMLVKHPCYIQTKMIRLYKKNDHLWSFFYIYTFLGSIFKLCYIQTVL